MATVCNVNELSYLRLAIPPPCLSKIQKACLTSDRLFISTKVRKSSPEGKVIFIPS